MLYRFSTMGQNWVKNYELLFGQDIDGVCIIREGEKYLLAKANYCPKCFEDVQCTVSEPVGQNRVKK